VAVLGARLLVPGLLVAWFGVLSDAPLAVIFAGFALVGTAIGMVATSGLTLLQSLSEPAEMGRVTSAHQFIRTLCITYAVAVGGALLLFVVDRQVGDVEAVRQVLAGDLDVAEAGLGPDTVQAVGDGLAVVIGFALCMAVLVLVTTQRMRKRAPHQIPT
jgi:hypothetical protein